LKEEVQRRNIFRFSRQMRHRQLIEMGKKKRKKKECVHLLSLGVMYEYGNAMEIANGI
jgi:hypothetical protein